MRVDVTGAPALLPPFVGHPERPVNAGEVLLGGTPFTRLFDALRGAARGGFRGRALRPSAQADPYGASHLCASDDDQSGQGRSVLMPLLYSNVCPLGLQSYLPQKI